MLVEIETVTCENQFGYMLLCPKLYDVLVILHILRYTNNIM